MLSLLAALMNALTVVNALFAVSFKAHCKAIALMLSAGNDVAFFRGIGVCEFEEFGLLGPGPRTNVVKLGEIVILFYNLIAPYSLRFRAVVDHRFTAL